jgi:hypothetical protein
MLAHILLLCIVQWSMESMRMFAPRRFLPESHTSLEWEVPA